MIKIDPIVMAVAGFDPSGGAGLLADIKSFEQMGVYGFGVATANTVQDDEEVKKVDWFSTEVVLEQMEALLQKYKVNHVKIGIIEDGRTFIAIKEYLIDYNPEIRIIWDPVLRSSSGYPFFKSDLSLESLLEDVFLITPNLPEFTEMFEREEEAMELSQKYNIYLKGGHSEKETGVDHLYSRGIKTSFSASQKIIYPKHGSGCVLSSAITAALASGNNLHDACRSGKHYTEQFLASHQSLLGWHKRYHYD